MKVVNSFLIVIFCLLMLLINSYACNLDVNKIEMNQTNDTINQYNSENQKIGRWIEYYDDGKIKSNAFFTDGKKDGRCYMYFENGNIESDAEMKLGKKTWQTFNILS